ncbi:merozoite surface protein, putative [Trichomonas vaginalis G3]|uniref:Merozoite surface protein, putative n=1 Tax=Trichomonas vaginalis (strain ATCC PRA-98 / G3) TaxID=412133 RepID=A2FE20_TRIV3|nr:hypothetical protein TVAGG3_0553490 [Trichomonas vaginalis G3]EAX96848.1 merozoite surface protein, putative [Trichomonas vaginalis G3]KAI5520687.1 hypothetical protein TVAGG3_0553490 [Trichomonas vaginalis G3]|eukprot:XP_001309778.1 merozoite surface protein [Trichomonas vaginalis G3]
MSESTNFEWGAVVILILIAFILCIWMYTIFIHRQSIKTLPNHIIYFKSSAKQIENQLQKSSAKSQASSKTGPQRQFLDSAPFPEFKVFLPEEIAPYGSKTISQPNINYSKDTTSMVSKETVPKSQQNDYEPVRRTPQSSNLFQSIQKDAEKLHDDTKKAEKERKLKEKQEKEEAKKKAEEEAAKKEEEQAKSTQKKLSTGGLGKISLGNLPKLTLKAETKTDENKTEENKAAPTKSNEAKTEEKKA